MDVKQNFERLTDETREYINLRIDSTKLYMIEALSLLVGNLLSHTLFFVFLFITLIFMLAALMFLLSTIVGFMFSALIVSFISLGIGIIIYMNRKKLFADIMVNSLCKLFFPKNEINDETY